jgi:hypothetical protein
MDARGTADVARLEVLSRLEAIEAELLRIVTLERLEGLECGVVDLLRLEQAMADVAVQLGRWG